MRKHRLCSQRREAPGRGPDGGPAPIPRYACMQAAARSDTSSIDHAVRWGPLASNATAMNAYTVCKARRAVTNYRTDTTAGTFGS